MNKVTKTAIVGLLALFAGNAAATDGEIVFDGEILKSACEINDSDKKIEVALGHYNAEQFRSVGDRSPKIPFTIPLVNCPVTGWEHDNGNVEASFRLWLETRDNGTVPNFPNLAKVGSFAGTAATGVGIRIDDAESGNLMPLNAMGMITRFIRSQRTPMVLSMLTSSLTTYQPLKHQKSPQGKQTLSLT